MFFAPAKPPSTPPLSAPPTASSTTPRSHVSHAFVFASSRLMPCSVYCLISRSTALLPPLISASVSVLASVVLNSSLPSTNACFSTFLKYDLASFTGAPFANDSNLSSDIRSKISSAEPCAIIAAVAWLMSPPFCITSLAAPTPAEEKNIAFDAACPTTGTAFTAAASTMSPMLMPVE